MLSKKEIRVALKSDSRWLQNWTNRYLAQLLVRFIVETRIQPNHLTICSMICGVASALFLILDSPAFRIVASICLFLSLVSDSADGQLARVRNQTSNFGFWFDKVTDRLKETLVIFAITYVAHRNSSDDKLWYLGTGVVALIGFMYYNLELLKKTFNSQGVAFPRNSPILQNLINFGYGERIFYISIFITINYLVFALWVLAIGCSFHISSNTYIAIKGDK